MIWESHPWKRRLKRLASDLEKRKGQAEISETLGAKLEQDLMLGFYAIRKLVDAKKVTKESEKRQVSLRRFPPIVDCRVTHMNWHDVTKHYDFESSDSFTKSLAYVFNQLIHSYVFLTTVDDSGGLEGFLFVSDRDRQDGLWSITLDEVVDIFLQIGNDHVISSHMLWNEKRKDFDVENHGPPSPC